ncbi:TRAP transporter substrate-binding protein [Anaerobacillus isosaccharinicus]|uniref:ABC transporter substrate-binding protein n=1 Tax=Anaerobacillus isosaccharinicus TaxID=1532552 RepID=A0A1S2M2U5_9BACI|nr:TRAP transporter substrate-binding protein [Anaerobacillus isosaccharinicus]MBA5588206.1 TRAP transporter substrate-binding protein [Anaerobacillus isosaccharinicus]QOY38345.1 TRAP transporter substrate-binding protein [Anaerobacillus isosaccharinicus]
MKKKLGLLFSTAILALGIVGCGGGDTTTPDTPQTGGDTAAPTEVKTMRAGIGLNDQHPQYKGLVKFKELVEEQTNGAIIVETYHSGQLGDDRTMTEALQLGSQEITIPSTAVIANFIPEFSVFDIPFLFPNEEVADAVLGGEVGEDLLERLADQRLVGLGYWENGFRDLTNSVRPVATIDDFKGLKIRTMENQLHLEAFRALGANPTPMAFTELFAAMQQGTVDGQENPYATIYLQKFFEVQDHVSDTHHIYSPWVFLVSKAFFDGLTPEQQEIVTNAAYEAGAYQRNMNRETAAEYLANLQAEGMTFTEITPEARQEMVDAVKPVIDRFADQIGRDVVDAVFQAVAEAQQ